MTEQASNPDQKPRSAAHKTERSGTRGSQTPDAIPDPASNGCVHELVSQKADEQPDAIAVTSRHGILSYRELECRGQEIAKRLRALGVGPESVVGLYVRRSMASLVGAFGILKSGGAYLPLDPSDPENRSAFMLEDAGVSVVVTERSLLEKVPRSGRKIIVLDCTGEIAESDSGATVPGSPASTDSNHLAYVIYTSGSTGTPKGVELTHANLRNLVSWHQSAFQITSRDRATHLARVGFDAAVWEIWPYLAAGASLHVVDDAVLNDPVALQAWLIAQSITISFVPTPVAERLLTLEWPRVTKLRAMLTGGDALHTFPRPDLPFLLVNNYGPTECAVVATSGLVPADRSGNRLPSIGRPIANTRIHLLDESQRLVSPGTPGEICIGGAGVARGYRNRPDLTAERFIPDPFSHDASRLFRTGDLAEFLPDGQLAFLGRLDEQVKIRGFRIEPNEIASVLNEHASISQSVIVAQEVTPGERRLVAYVVLKPEQRGSFNELREFLNARLPNYMVPTTFVRLESLPLTPNGKVNRAALPVPDETNTIREGAFRGPETDVEKMVAAILAPLLGVEQIDVEANFFALGGHSLLGTQLISRLRECLGVEVPLRTVFEAPSVMELAAEIERLLYEKLEAMSEEEVQQTLNVASHSRT